MKLTGKMHAVEMPRRPRKGAWIEILHALRHTFATLRRPRKGAWIEIGNCGKANGRMGKSPPQGGVD